MPLTTYSPQVRHEGYDLINQAFNRFVTSQMPKPVAPIGPGDQAGGLQTSGGQQTGINTSGQPGFQTSGQQPQQQPQGNPQPNFFNRNQPGPVHQNPDGFGVGGGGQGVGQGQPGGSPLGQGGQGGFGGLGQLLALLGPLQSGQGFLPSLFGGQQGYQKPAMFPSLLQEQAGQYGNPQQGPLAELFNPQSYSGSAMAGMAGPRNWGGGNPNAVALNPQVRSEALSYILQQLAMSGMPQPQAQPTGSQGAGR